MRAAYIEQTGPPESIKVGDLPRPDPAPGEVLVRVGAAAFNPIDLYLRSGMVAMPMAFPYVVGSDLAGTVESLGRGASKFKVGDRVWGSNRGLLGKTGAAAEFVAVEEDLIYPTPANLPDTEAAAMALVGITAHLGVCGKAKLKSGETLYVPGGSGGVGSMVVQMAKAIGARVATSAGSAERVTYCRSIGADLALDYKSDDIPAKLREFAPDGIDVWFETLREPNFEMIVPLLRKGGRIVVIAGRAAKSVMPVGPFYTRDASLYGFAMFNASHADQQLAADDMNKWSASGQLKAPIGRSFPIAETAAAQRLLEDNSVGGAGTLHGKVVITIEG